MTRNGRELPRIEMEIALECNTRWCGAGWRERCKNRNLASGKRGKFTPPGSLTFADLVRLKREDAVAKQNRTMPEPSRALREYFGYEERDGAVVQRGRKVVEITDNEIAKFKAWRLGSGVKVDTMQADLRWLRHAFNLAVSARLIPRDAVPIIKLQNPGNVRTRFPTDEELGRVLDALAPEFRAVVLFAAMTAWRVRSMVLPLRWEHVDWREKLVTLPAELSKNKQPVKFPFGPWPRLRELLEHQLRDAERTASRFVFFHPSDGRPIAYKTMRKAWRAACRKAGCAGFWLHDLCRVGARNLRRAGLSEAEVMLLGRWKTGSMFRRYDIVDVRDLEAAIAKVAAQEGGQ